MLNGGYDGRLDNLHGGAGRDQFVRFVSKLGSGFGGLIIVRETDNMLDFNAVDDAIADVIVPGSLAVQTSLVLGI